MKQAMPVMVKFGGPIRRKCGVIKVCQKILTKVSRVLLTSPSLIFRTNLVKLR